MRLTRFGFWVVLATLFSLFGAATSGSNLLTLVNGMLLAVLLVSAFSAWHGLGGLRADFVFPGQVFQATEFSLGIAVRNTRRRPARQFALTDGRARAACARLEGGTTVELALPVAFPLRGRNALRGWALESSHPFGLFRSTIPLPGVFGLAFPRLDEMDGRLPFPAVREETVALPRRGVGDEFYGLRDYVEGEDSRLIHWKLTAKTGTPIVKEYAQQLGHRITIEACGAPGGPETERRIAEAASAARYHIDSGAEVRLVTDEGTLDYGRGLLHLEAILTNLALLGEGKNDRDPAPPPNREPGPVSRAAPAAPYLCAGIALASLLLVEDLNPVLVLLAAPLLLLARIFDRKRIHPVPKPALDTLTGLYLLFFLFFDIRRSGIQGAVTHLVLYILATLVLLPKTDRQTRQIFLTSFLIFYIASGQAVSLWYFGLFLAFFLAAGTWLNGRLDGGPVRKPAWTAASAGLVLVSFGLAGASFIVMPRLSSSRMQRFLAAAGLSRFQANARSFSGLTERVELGYMGPLRKNSARAMQVGFPDSAVQAAPPPFVRIRGGAFDAFDGKRWRKTRSDFVYDSGDRKIATRHAQAWMRRDAGTLASPVYDPAKPSAASDFVIFPLLNTALVFGLGEISAIEGGPSGAVIDFTDTVSFPSAYLEGVRYRVLSQAETPTYYLRIEAYEGILKEKYLGIPGGAEKYAPLAREFAGAADDPISRARAIEARFRGGFAYSLSAAAGRQTLDDFLFRNRAGNCEFFATAMCLLLRALDIPSRLVIGFLGEEWNAYGRFFDIRQSDAHAWVEAFIVGRGWVTFDPTPSLLGQARNPGLLARVWGSIDQAFQALQYRWYRDVVGFDTDTRQNLLYNLKLELSPLLLKILIGLAAAAGTFAALILLPRRRRRSARRGGAGGGGDALYQAVLERLARAGYLREPWQTGIEYAEGVRGRNPALAPLSDLTALHNQARFSGRPLTGPERADGERLAGRIRDALPRRRKRSCRISKKPL